MNRLKSFILFALLINFSMSKPLNKNFQCVEAVNEQKFFRSLLNNSTNIDNIISSSLSYFNISEIYKSILLEKIKIYCLFKKQPVSLSLSKNKRKIN